jgi:hypothetical protein
MFRDAFWPAMMKLTEQQTAETPLQTAMAYARVLADRRERKW